MWTLANCWGRLVSALLLLGLAVSVFVYPTLSSLRARVFDSAHSGSLSFKRFAGNVDAPQGKLAAAEGDEVSQFLANIEQARACHGRCLGDPQCRQTCPVPWRGVAQACEELKAIKPCHERCAADPDAAQSCEASCPTFSDAELARKFAKMSGYGISWLEQKCAKLAGVVACHKACASEGLSCVRACPKLEPQLVRGHHWIHRAWWREDGR